MSDYDLVLASLAAVHAKLDTLLELLKVPEPIEWISASCPPPYEFDVGSRVLWEYSIEDGGGTAGLV